MTKPDPTERGGHRSPSEHLVALRTDDMRVAQFKIVLATIIFGINPALFKIIRLNPVDIFWTVNLIAAVSVTAYALLFRRHTLRVIIDRNSYLLLALAIVFTINNVLFIGALKRTSVAVATFTHYSAPVFVALVVVFIYRRGSKRNELIALILSITGLSMFLLGEKHLSFHSHDFVGFLMGLASAIFFAWEILYKERLAAVYATDWIVVVYLLASVLFLSPFVSFQPMTSLDMNQWLVLVFSGVVGSGVGISLFTSGMRYVSAQPASLISELEPVAAVIFGVILLDEIPTPLTVLGGALILIGLYFTISVRTSASSKPDIGTITATD
jgi:drug/metabolite transporter (DMT)-like permease